MRLFLSILAFIAPLLAMQGSRYAELPAELDGSMSLYDFNSVESRQLPDSLRPVWISYIARHGARYLTSEKKILDVEKMLHEARERGSLTLVGKACLKLMEQIRGVTDGQWGMLSAIGEAQELRLGREMVRMFPEVFSRDGAGINAVSSYVPRVIETMNKFNLAIADTIIGLHVSSSSGSLYDRLARFFVAVPEYDRWREEGEWRDVYKEFTSRNLPVGPALRMLGKDSGMSDERLRRFSYDLYKVLQGLRAMGMSAPTSEWMTPDEYSDCWHATNLEKYFQYSISSLSSIPAQGASDVLFNLIQQQEALLNGSQTLPGLWGLFGHAETLLPIFALLGVPETTAFPADFERLYDVWSDAVLTPLAANLAIIYSSASSGRLYASMRLNGRNVSPVNDPQRLTVPVSELRDYWLNRYLQLNMRTK